MRVLVVDDHLGAEAVIVRALSPAQGNGEDGTRHPVVGVRSPAALRKRDDLGSFDVAFVDMVYGRNAPESGLAVLRLLDHSDVRTVIYTTATEDNRVMYVLAAFQFFRPVGLLSKEAPETEVRELLRVMSDPYAEPRRTAIARYLPPRNRASLLDQLIGSRNDLLIWRALATHESRSEVAAVARVAPRTVDNFMSSHFEAMRSIQAEFLSRTMRGGPEARDRTVSRLVPMHAFAVQNAGFFQDADLEFLIRERDLRSSR